MAEAVRQATVAAEPYIRGSKRFQPLHAEYLREDGKPFSVNKGKNGWLVIFVPTPMAERKIYVVIPPDGREPEVLVMYH